MATITAFLISLILGPIIIKLLKIENIFSNNDTINNKTLFKKGLIKDLKTKVKIVGPGNFNKYFKFRDVRISKKLYIRIKKIAQEKSSKISNKLSSKSLKKRQKYKYLK